MFRPEMLEPMGLDPDVRVIAWGLSLERPTMIKYKIDNIREVWVFKFLIILIFVVYIYLFFHSNNNYLLYS